MNATSDAIATRGQRLVLTRARFSGGDEQPEAFHVDLLHLVEIDADERITAIVALDLDEIDAAFAELEARYRAGEAAAHANTWSIIEQAYAALNTREIGATAPDWVTVDHRRLPPSAGDLTADARATWNLVPNVMWYVEAVHSLSDLGAVLTHAASGTSKEGFDAERRGIDLVTAEGDFVKRVEVFDEADLDAALARFEELRPQTRLENAASQVHARFRAIFAARDWDALAGILAEDVSVDDRRRVVNAGVRHGRAIDIADMRAAAEIGVTNIASTVVGTRGERLVLSRNRLTGRDQRPDAFQEEVIDIVEIDHDDRICARIFFDDIDAAFAELDARYLAGEAAAYAHTWSLVTGAYAALDRRELSATTPDWINVDHRKAAAFAPGEMIAYLNAGWGLGHEIKNYIVAVHRLNTIGAVVTHASHGRSKEGFDAEWRETALVTFEGDLLSRAELFDEADVDRAIAKFDQLSQPAPRLENTASRVGARYLAHFAPRDWDTMAEMLADDFWADDRRHVVNAGVRQGRDTELANLRAVADVGIVDLTSMPIAIRGERLVLARHDIIARDSPDGSVAAEVIDVVEINGDNKISTQIMFDTEDLDAAFAELDARYLAGEAAAHSHTWSLIMRTADAFNRHEVPPTTPGWVNIDHRRATAFAAGDFPEYMRAAWDQIPDLSLRIEAVHRLSDFGAVLANTLRGTSQEGFEAEWREVHLMTVEGGLFNRVELFDGEDIAAAVTAFDQLSQSAARLENTASRVNERLWQHFNTRDWEAMARVLADDVSADDRRRTANAGTHHGRNAAIDDFKATAEVGFTNLTSTVVAARGERLILTRLRASGDDPGGIQIEVLHVVETDTDQRLAAFVVFDLDDIDAAFKELDARYAAGEAAPYSDTWSMVVRVCAAFNRHELYATTPDWVNIDHRQVLAFEEGELTAYIQAAWTQIPDLSFHIEVVHRLSGLGALYTRVLKGTSKEGFIAEWRFLAISTFEGGLLSRAEYFDEADLDTAIARFEELSRSAPQLENAATRANERLQACLITRDFDVMANLLSEDTSLEDRRRVVNAGTIQGRESTVAILGEAVHRGVTNVTTAPIAIRGERLALGRVQHSAGDEGPEAFHSDLLDLVEIDADDRIVANVLFDVDDIDAAFAELDAHYLAGEAAAYARVWQVAIDTVGELNRHEPGPLVRGTVYADHRRVPFAPGEFGRAIEDLWKLVPDARYRADDRDPVQHGLEDRERDLVVGRAERRTRASRRVAASRTPARTRVVRPRARSPGRRRRGAGSPRLGPPWWR